MNQHGDQISIDVSKEPPIRTLALSNSDYAIETDTFIGKLHQPEAEYQSKRAAITTELKTINLLQTDYIQEYIADLVNHEYRLEEIQRNLKLVFNLDTGSINSLDDLASPFRLEREQKKLEQQLHAVESEYVQSMKKAIDLHRKEIFELDEKTREVLKYVADIGFDLIPKKYTDQLINEVKS